MATISEPDTYPESVYCNQTEDGAFFQSNSRYIFCDLERKTSNHSLDVKITQSQADIDSDSFTNLVLPLVVILSEEFQEKEVVTGFEDTYHFTHDGDFMGHEWKHYQRKTGSKRREYTPKRRGYDGDLTKLYHNGETIKFMIGDKEMHPKIQNHPTVQRLKTHALWNKLPLQPPEK